MRFLKQLIECKMNLDKLVKDAKVFYDSPLSYIEYVSACAGIDKLADLIRSQQTKDAEVFTEKY